MALAHLGGAGVEQAEVWVWGEVVVAVEWEEHDLGPGPVGSVSVPIAAPEYLIRQGLRATI